MLVEVEVVLSAANLAASWDYAKELYWAERWGKMMAYQKVFLLDE